MSVANDGFIRIADIAARAEDNVIRKALTDHLGRPATKADAAYCQKVFKAGDSMRYWLAYKGTILTGINLIN